MDKRTQTGRRWAGMLIVVACGLVAFGNWVILGVYGEDATISATTNDVAYSTPIFPLALGGLIVGLLVHWFGWSPRSGQQ